MTAPFTTGAAGTSMRWAHLRSTCPTAPGPERGDRLLVVAAHPDDETLGAGGLLATAEAAGAQVTVIVATDGDASHPHSRTHSPRDLAAVRRREVYAALAAIAPSAEVHLLGLPDGALAGHADELTAALLDAGVDCTHIVTPWVDDRHPDHEACARAGAAAARRFGAQHWQYPVWAWHWGDPQRGDLPTEGLTRVDIDPAAQLAKERAIGCYASQCAPLSGLPGDETVLSPAMLDHFRTATEFFYVSTPAEASNPTFFNRLYAQAPDPWGLRDRFYERRKRAALLAALPKQRFRRAFEPGCALGLLTAELAHRCDEVIAWDIAGAAVAATRAETAAARAETAEASATGRVGVEVGRIPDEWPTGRFDLVVLSEVGYYCADLGRLVERIDACLEDDGVLVACHWRHPASMHAQSAADVHAALGEHRQPVVSHIEADFLLHVWTRSGRSVAQDEGMVP